MSDASPGDAVRVFREHMAAQLVDGVGRAGCGDRRRRSATGPTPIASDARRIKIRITDVVFEHPGIAAGRDVPAARTSR